jgi:antitoxin HigA-1
MAKKLPPVHPGEVLRDEFLRPSRLTRWLVLSACRARELSGLAKEQTPVTADTALRLGRYFGTSAAFWMGIQTQYDLERAEDDAAQDCASPRSQTRSLTDADLKTAP